MAETPNTINPNTPEASEKSAISNFSKATTYLKEFLKDILHLEDGVDKRAVIEEIKNKKSMSGANAWMLICSIMIASIGLDQNSSAVIIGAMLISPLMSPILGIGLGVGINDKVTLKNSLTHFSLAIAIALVTSFIYFYISPLSTLTPQIEARTEPTFLDIIIAFFGGIAGIVSIARKDISTTIPGVAIATALMPPLCVSGYGLANGNWEIATSSFYLFFLNTFFVSLSTYIMIRFLDFPLKDFVNKKEQWKNRLYIGLFSILIIIPSIFIFNKVIKRVRNDLKVQQFMNEVIGKDNTDTFVDEYKFTPGKGDDPNLLIIKAYGDTISMDNIAYYNAGLKLVDLQNTNIKIIRTSEITMDQFENLDQKINGMEQMAKRIEVVQEENKQSDQAIAHLQSELSSFKIDTSSYNATCNQLKLLFPNISGFTYAKGQSTDFKNHSNEMPLVIVNWEKRTRDQKEKEEKVSEFLKLNLRMDSLYVVQLVGK